MSDRYQNTLRARLSAGLFQPSNEDYTHVISTGGGHQ